MSPRLRKILLVFVAILLIGGPIAWKLVPKGEKELSYQEFRTQVVDGTLADTEVAVETSRYNADLRFEHEDTKHKVGAPKSDELYKFLDEHNVNYEMEPDTDWLGVFIVGSSGLIFLSFFALPKILKRNISGENKKKMLTTAHPDVTFKDVAGIDEARAEVEEIMDFLRNPEKYKKVGARVPKGVLLSGPPGTGKTLVARALAGEAKLPFFSLSGSEFISMWSGMGGERIRDLFEQGRKNAPCILFIDEIDAIGRARGNSHGDVGADREATLNQLLVELDGFDGSQGVILVAATNRPDILDDALLRPGRFDRRITVGLPDVKGREAILKVHLANVPTDEDVDPKKLAYGTPQFSGADLTGLVNEAALCAARNGREKVNESDLEYARDRVMMGLERKSMKVSIKQKEHTAWHEAGHALVAELLPEDLVDPVHKVTIIPRGPSLGTTSFLPEQERLSLNSEVAKAKIAVLLGGRVAEELMPGGHPDAGASDDIKRATEIARKMVCEWGMSKLGAVRMTDKNEYSEKTAQEVDEQIRHLVMIEQGRAKKLVEKNLKALKRIAEALIEHEVLDGAQVRTLIQEADLIDPRKGERVA